MSQPHITVGYGHNTHAFLAECATCGKPYHPDGHWRTAYTHSEKPDTVVWLLYCVDCFDKLEKVGA